MASIFRNRITVIWLVLVAATVASWEMGHGFGIHSKAAASVAILVVAFVKARFVVLDFMELRNAPRFMRVIAEVWAVLVCSVLIGLYLQHPSI